MRYFIDTEFVFDAKRRTVDPISVGIVAEDGREFYAVSTEFNKRRAPLWVKTNVLPLLPDRDVSFYDSPRRKSEAMAWGNLADIGYRLRRFIGDDVPEFWGDYAAFDYVVLSIIMGGFDAWPRGWPMSIRDLQETPAGRAASDSVMSLTPHNALCDARAVRDAWAIAHEPYEGGS